MQAHPSSDRTKQTARREFERWSRTYDRSILQTLIFRPTYEIMLEEVVRWRIQCDPRLAEPFDALDVGCGTGSWAATLIGSSLAARVVGLDYTMQMCHKSREKAASLFGRPLPALNGDSEHLPFRDRSFDLVTCSHSFHHYPNQAHAVCEMRRVLRPGGRLMLVDGFRDNCIGWFVFDVGVAWKEGAVHHRSWSDIRAMFGAAGFREIAQRKFNIWAPAVITVGAVAPEGQDAADDKSEIRSTKSETNSKHQMTEGPKRARREVSDICAFGFRNLFPISDFGFRASTPEAAA